MRRDMRMRQGLANIRFDSFGPIVADLHRPLPRNQNMQGHEGTPSGLTGTQGVEIQTLMAIPGQQGFNLRQFFFW